jgi:phosphoglycolate phosphatase-like HAD superfamily hydrolase
MPGQLLVLFDIDGTMLLNDAYAHGRALVSAMRSVYAVDLPDDAVQRAQPWGKTDLQIARGVLRAAGLADDEINGRASAWVGAAAAAFVSEAAASAAQWRVRPGLPEALERLERAGMRLTVLTGNLRAIATVKLEGMGLATQLDLAIGAYGDDREERTSLVPIARERAGTAGRPWPRERAAVVGDAPGDIAAARADRVRSAIFTSSRFPEAALEGADAVIATTDELVATLEAWQSPGSLHSQSGVADLVPEDESKESEQGDSGERL